LFGLGALRVLDVLATFLLVYIFLPVAATNLNLTKEMIRRQGALDLALLRPSFIQWWWQTIYDEMTFNLKKTILQLQ
jgi:hypothetical protein